MIGARHICISVFLGIFCALGVQAVPFHVETVDETGAAFPDVLVIVRSLDGNGESFRALTDREGAVPKHELSPRLYQLIATCPYGICQTTLHEFMVAGDPIHFELPLKVVPTTGNIFITSPVQHRQVEVQDVEGRPLASAQILVRDAIAQYQKWYQTGANGIVTIDLPPGGETTVIAIYHGSLASRILQPNAPNSEDELVLIRF